MMDKDKLLENTMMLFVDCVKSALVTGQEHLVNCKEFEGGMKVLLNALSDDETIEQHNYNKSIKVHYCPRCGKTLDILDENQIAKRKIEEYIATKPNSPELVKHINVYDIFRWLAKENK